MSDFDLNWSISNFWRVVRKFSKANFFQTYTCWSTGPQKIQIFNHQVDIFVKIERSEGDNYRTKKAQSYIYLTLVRKPKNTDVQTHKKTKNMLIYLNFYSFGKRQTWDRILWKTNKFLKCIFYKELQKKSYLYSTINGNK